MPKHTTEALQDQVEQLLKKNEKRKAAEKGQGATDWTLGKRSTMPQILPQGQRKRWFDLDGNITQVQRGRQAWQPRNRLLRP